MEFSDAKREYTERGSGARKNVKHAPRALHNASVISGTLGRKDVYNRTVSVIYASTNWDKDFPCANGAGRT